MKRFLSSLIAAMIVVVSFAQVTSSGLSGVVKDPSGANLLGATVVATHTPSGTQYGAVVNADGRYYINGMRPGGPYTVEIAYVGYQTAEFTGISLELGSTYNCSTKLSDNVSLEKVVVTSSASDRFNNAKTGAATNFSSEAIAQTPSIDRSVFDVVKSTPQANVSKDGGIVFAGASNRYNSFQVDGSMTNDVFGLTDSGTNGGQTGTNPISLDAIEAIQVAVAPFDVRQSGFTGGAINAITKSGNNTFSGSVYGFYNNQDFYGVTPGFVDYERTKLTEQSTYTAGVTAGGPIIKDKLFFFVSAETYANKYPTSYYAGLEGYISVEDANRIIDIYKDKTGLDENFDVIDVETKSQDFMARLDWNINAKNKFMFRYQLKDAYADRGTASKSYATMNNSGYRQTNLSNTFVAELNTRISNEMSNELRASYNRVRDLRDPDVQAPTINIAGVAGVNSFVCLGTEYSSGVNQLDQDIFTLTDNFNIYKGNHTITLGTHNEFYSIANGYIQYANGSYTFDSIDDFEAGIASQYKYNYSDVSITGTPRWMANFRSGQFGLYAQDEWRPSQQLTVTYGVRADLPVFFTQPTENPTFNATEVAAGGAYTVGRAPKTRVLWSPRAGFRYYFDEDHNTLLRGGVGIFTGRIPFVWVSNVYGNTGMEMKSITYQASKGDTIPPFTFTPTVPESGAPNNSVNTISEDFRFPQVFRGNLALEHIFDGGWKVTAEALYSKTLNNIYFNNIAYKHNEGDYFYPVAGNTEIKSPVYSKIDKVYSSAVNLENSNAGYTYDLSLAVVKSFEFGLDVVASYSYGHAYSAFDGGSSVAYSNWKKHVTNDPGNHNDVTFSRYDIPHRLNLTLNYTSPRYANGRLNTVVGLTYQGYSGSRYSYVYDDYNVDVNGDGYAGNSLMYIPTDDEIQNMDWATDEDKYSFMGWLDENPAVKANQGSWSERNAVQAPFEHHFNLHVSENIYYNKQKNKKVQISLDLLNASNLLNPTWGLYYSQPYPSVQILAVDGKGKYSVTGDGLYASSFSSRWHMQLGARITF